MIAEFGRNLLEAVTGLLGLAALLGWLLGYVTRRDPSLYVLTHRWLWKNGFPIAASPLEFVQDGSHTCPEGMQVCKSAVVGAWARHRPSDQECILVEDSPFEARTAATNGIRVVMLRAPYNAAFETEIALAIEEANAHGTETPLSRITFITELEELL